MAKENFHAREDQCLISEDDVGVVDDEYDLENLSYPPLYFLQD